MYTHFKSCYLCTEVTGEWRRLHNEELNDLYCSPNIVWVIKSRRMRWAGHVARMGQERGAYRVLVGKPEVKRPLGRPRRRWRMARPPVVDIGDNLLNIGFVRSVMNVCSVCKYVVAF